MKHESAAGRPTKYLDTATLTALIYATDYEEGGDTVPTVAGLAILLGVARSTVYLWAKDYPEISDAVDLVLPYQERALVNGGLSGKFSAPITKLMMGAHGYADKQELDHRSGDGSMTPRTLDDFYSAINPAPDTKPGAS